MKKAMKKCQRRIPPDRHFEDEYGWPRGFLKVLKEYLLHQAKIYRDYIPHGWPKLRNPSVKKEEEKPAG